MKKLFGCMSKDNGSDRSKHKNKPLATPVKCEVLHQEYFHTGQSDSHIPPVEATNTHNVITTLAEPQSPSSITPPTSPSALIGQYQSHDTLPQSHNQICDNLIGSTSVCDNRSVQSASSINQKNSDNPIVKEELVDFKDSPENIKDLKSADIKIPNFAEQTYSKDIIKSNLKSDNLTTVLKGYKFQGDETEDLEECNFQSSNKTNQLIKTTAESINTQTKSHSAISETFSNTSSTAVSDCTKTVSGKQVALCEETDSQLRQPISKESLDCLQKTNTDDLISGSQNKQDDNWQLVDKPDGNWNKESNLCRVKENTENNNSKVDSVKEKPLESEKGVTAIEIKDLENSFKQEPKDLVVTIPKSNSSDHQNPCGNNLIDNGKLNTVYESRAIASNTFEISCIEDCDSAHKCKPYFKDNSELQKLKNEGTAVIVDKDSKEVDIIRDDISEVTNVSLTVNVDTDSDHTVTDTVEEFCTQYSREDSDTGSLKFDNSKATYSGGTDTDSDYDFEFEDTVEDCFELKVKDQSLITLKEELANAAEGLLESDGENNAEVYNLGEIAKIKGNTESNNSIYDSFYSFTNETSHSVPVTKSTSRKTLKWMPRILSETRYSSNNSGNFSDVASFYTADTCGTFYSARDFQLDSCDNFQTCDDFQKVNNNNNNTNKSKLSRAKEALSRGKDFVKSKLENYKKRLPNLRKSNSGEHKSCHRSCGFSCVHLGKEISQYSLPECDDEKGDHSNEIEDNSSVTVTKGGKCENIKADINIQNGCELQNDTEIAKMSEQGCVEMINKRKEGIVGLSSSNLANHGQNTDQEIADGRATGTQVGQGPKPVRKGIMTVKMKDKQRDSTQQDRDDLPVGAEAVSIPRNKSISSTENGDGSEQPSSKRLRWLSAVGRTQGSSLTSSITSNNSSVEQFLNQREMDPETLLNNLGFGIGPTTEDPLYKIPDRFLLDQRTTRGINLHEFVQSHPELHHLLPIWEKQCPLKRNTPVVGAGSNTQTISNGTGNQNQESQSTKGSMQRPHAFSSVMQGMKFIQSVQQSPPSPDEEVKKISSIPSVLDFPNRKALAKQGFYGSDYVPKVKLETAEGESPKSDSDKLSAAQKRKQFHHCSKSKNWSLTEESELLGNEKELLSEDSSGSFDEGLRLRSFSERYSSDSSLESMDSLENHRQMIRQNSISHLRRQYQETIRQSMDGEMPVFDEDLDKDESETDASNKGLGVVRKVQVDRLMLSLDDDGDYFANSRQSSIKEVEPMLKRAQNSTQSTISGSPMTPKDFNFSFEKGLKDGESEFDFSSPTSPKSPYGSHKVLSEGIPAVSIIVEDESEETILGEVTCEHSNPNELTPLSLVERSDSCNTLVPQYSETDGELTPRAGDESPAMMLQQLEFNENEIDQVQGDALSESTSSLDTLITMLPSDLVLVERKLHCDRILDELDGDLRSYGSRSSDGVRGQLKPGDQFPPQESFELEEISSGDHAMYEDMNGNSLKTKRGHMEKSASTHSDSSGFADVDPMGEALQGIMDLPKETSLSRSAKPSLRKQKTFEIDENNKSEAMTPYSNNKTSHDAIFSELPVTCRYLQTESSERLLDDTTVAFINRKNMSMNKKLESETKQLNVCRKSDENVEKTFERDTKTTPSLSSISYDPVGRQYQDNHVVYTLNIPLTDAKQTKKKPKAKRRYVSEVNMDVIVNADDDASVKSDKNVSESSLTLHFGPVIHREIGNDLDPNTCDLDPNTCEFGDNLNEFGDKYDQKDAESKLIPQIQKATLSQKLNQSNHSQLPSNQSHLPSNQNENVIHTVQYAELNNSPMLFKRDILSKKRSKESLIASNNQTADWLLSNERQTVPTDTGSPRSAQKKSSIKIGKPIWASTPDLKGKPNYRASTNQNRAPYKDGSHSLELLSDEDSEVNFHTKGGFLATESRLAPQATRPLLGKHEANSKYFPHQHSADGIQRQSSADDIQYDRCQNFQAVRQDSSSSSMDESIVIQRQFQTERPFQTGSDSRVPTDELQYQRLARLVNGQSLVTSPSTKMPSVKFTPNFHSKNWMELPKKKHLEEETRLMQHAVQRYKTELTAMETMLFNMYQTALPDLNGEERCEVEELQHLWSEVRKEVMRMDELLSVRLSAVMSGNFNYSPLDGLEIVQSMINLLREQLYQQQMAICNDISITEYDLCNHDDMYDSRSINGSVRSVSSNGPWFSDLSQQMADVKNSVMMSEENQKESLKQSISELKHSLLTEVKGELLSTQHNKMVELKLQEQENEIRRLKMELLLQSGENGGTRRIQSLESDV